MTVNGHEVTFGVPQGQLLHRRPGDARWHAIFSFRTTPGSSQRTRTQLLSLVNSKQPKTLSKTTSEKSASGVNKLLGWWTWDIWVLLWTEGLPLPHTRRKLWASATCSPECYQQALTPEGEIKTTYSFTNRCSCHRWRTVFLPGSIVPLLTGRNSKRSKTGFWRWCSIWTRFTPLKISTD